jgi:DNA-binding CsgD family transcriptional regulator
VQSTLAVTTLFLGDPDGAMRIIQECMERCRAHGDRWWLSNAYSTAANIAIRSHELSAGAAYLRRALELTQPLGGLLIVATGVEWFGWIAGANGAHERAARLLGAADQMWQRLGGILFGATEWLRGHHTCEAEARAALGDAGYEAAFRAGGALPADEAVAYAIEDDQKPAQTAKGFAAGPEPAGGPVLTPRQRQVAELVADGLSNREIAARLVTSPRTAESHVENILRKLGFTSRAQIAVWIINQRNGTD